MDADQQQALWSIASEHYDAAELCARQGWHNVSVACSYYAVYTAMWVALGNPTQGKWLHGRIIQHFATGQWRRPPAPVDRMLTRAIRRLYSARLRAQYRGEAFTAPESIEGLRTTHQVIQIVAGAVGLPFGRSTP
jgi:uncharacterized protein (UPF0332 family)